MRAVHFGAGNIGRGFIGLLLSRSGYGITFVDVNDRLVNALQERGEYTVALASEDRTTELVNGVTAIHGSRTDEVARAIAEADLVTTAVGVLVLPHIAGALAEGIRLRLQAKGKPLAVIACENTLGGSTLLKNQVFKHLTEEEQRQAEACVAFPDAAVDRIVPLQRHEDPLFVTVEPFYEWVVARTSLETGLPDIGGVKYVDSLEPYIARKLFTVNTGHCCAAYYGYLSGFETIQQVMADAALRTKVQEVLRETGRMLSVKFGFDEQDHEHYMEKILERFTNPFLTDDVKRVGRSPLRKLSPNDRLVRPAMLAYELGLGVEHLTAAMAAAMHFDDREDPEAVELQKLLQEQGPEGFIAGHMDIAPEHPLYGLILSQYDRLHMEQESEPAARKEALS